jgi:hypothetical protein
MKIILKVIGVNYLSREIGLYKKYAKFQLSISQHCQLKSVSKFSFHMF